MDNRTFDIRSDERDDFNLAMRIASGRRVAVTHYAVHDGDLVLFWVRPERADETVKDVPFGYFDVAEATDFAWRWLSKVKDTDRKEFCDHDGSNGRGFRVFCNRHGGDDHFGRSAFVRIQAIWAWYGK